MNSSRQSGQKGKGRREEGFLAAQADRLAGARRKEKASACSVPESLDTWWRDVEAKSSDRKGAACLRQAAAPTWQFLSVWSRRENRRPVGA